MLHEHGCPLGDVVDMSGVVSTFELKGYLVPGLDSVFRERVFARCDEMMSVMGMTKEPIRNGLEPEGRAARFRPDQ